MSLLAPLFLLGLLGLAVPWILHRLQQRDAPATDFPSKRFLKTTSSNTARRKRLRFRGLLSVRWLLLALLCLLFAEPLLKHVNQAFAEPRTMHLLVLDNSFSMRFGDRWQRAIAQLEDVLADLDSDDAVTLMLADNKMEIVQIGNSTEGATEQTSGSTDSAVSSTSGDQGNSADTVEGLQRQLQVLSQNGPGNRRLQFDKMMDGIARFATDSDLPVVAHIVTDAQRNAANAGFNALYRDELQGMNLYNVNQSDDNNFSVHASANWKDENTVAVEARVLWSVDSVVVADETGAETMTLTVSSGDNVLASSEIDLTRGSAINVDFDAVDVSAPLRQLDTTSADRTALLELQVRIDGELLQADGLEQDNVAKLGLARHAPQHIRLLATDPRAQENALIYLTTAFRQMQNVDVEEISAGSNRLPPDTDLLIVLQSRGDALLPRLADGFLQNGGAVLQVLGGPSSAGLTQGFSASADRLAQQLQIEADPLTRVDTAHPLTLNARDWSEALLYREIWDGEILQHTVDLMARTGAGVAASQPSGNSAESLATDNSLPSPLYVAETLALVANVLVSSNRGTPLLLEPLHKDGASSRDGRLIVLAAPLDGSSSNLPISPVFVSFLDELRAYLLQSARYPRELFSGETMNFDSNVQLLSPLGEPVFKLGSGSGSGTRSYTLDDAGAYVILDQNGQHVVQVNVDPAESDLQALTASGLELWRQQYREKSAGTASAAESATESSTDPANNSIDGSEVHSLNADDKPGNVNNSDRETGTPLWRWLLPALLIAGLLELIMGNWHLGRFRRALTG